MNPGLDTLPLDAFRFKQLVFVNSAAYAYTQIRIDQHTALFGENNLGKTSMLNALKLFLLPEVNFRNCPAKFNFRGTNGKIYDGLASFRYYFPEDRAFIILEAENPHNDFCIVLHRGGATDKQEYARMVVPRPYRDIEHLFWNMEASAENGVGAPVEEMTLQRTLATLRNMGGEPLSERKAIQERLFTNQPYDRKAGRFSLLPLRNGAGTREIEAWRKLIHLAFDISAQDGRTLPDTLATIIEGQKTRKQEQLNLDLNAIVDEANQLREQGDRITRIVNATHDWEAFDRLYQRERSQRQAAAQAYVDLEMSLATEKTRLGEAVELASQALQEAARREENLREQQATLGKNVTVAETTLQNTQKNAEELRQEINLANATINRFPGSVTHQEILEALDEQMAEKQQAITGYEDKAVARDNLEKVHSRIQQNEREVRRLQSALEDRAPTLLDTLPQTDASILHSLNPVLGTTHGELTAEQQQAFTHFSRQFHTAHDHLMLDHPQEPIHLQGIRFQSYDAEQTRQRMEQQLQDLKERVKKDRKTREKLNEEAKLPAAEIARLKQAAEQALAELKRERNALNARDGNEEKLKALDETLTRLEGELKEGQALLSRTEEEWKEAAASRQSAARRHNEAKEEDNRISQYGQRLRSIGKDANNVFEGLHPGLTATPCPVTEGAVESLEDDTRELRRARQEVEQRLRALLSRGLIPDVESHALMSSYGAEQITGFHEQLRAIFNNLDTEQVNFRIQVERHNMTTHSQVEILRTAKDQVSAFMRSINAEMGRFRISNLDEIRIDFRLHPRFQQLLQDLEEADLLGADLQDKRVYDQLKAFQADFFNKDASRSGVLLSLDKILDAVTYSYRLSGEDHWTSNAQSNGTNMMITTNLLSVLMARLMEPDTQVQMPLVMDEFGSLATRNMRTARDMAERHGYCLFVANPNRDSKITQILENYVHLGLFHADRAYAENRSIVHHGLCESLTQRGRVKLRESNPGDALPASATMAENRGDFVQGPER